MDPFDTSTGVARIADHAADWLAEPEMPARKARVRARTISIKRMSKREQALHRALTPDTDHDRPRTRGECLHGPHAIRPCPFVGCAHHLYLSVNSRTGSIKLHFPDMEPDELTETCALDVADRGGLTLEEVGKLLNFSRERARQIETSAIDGIQGAPGTSKFRLFLEGGR